MATKPKKASTSYSPAPMGRAEKSFTRYAAREKQVGKYGMTKQKDGRLTINVGKKPSTASKVAGTVGKVAGKAAGIAKSKVKADIKAAKTVAGVAGKVAGKAAGVAKSNVKANVKAAKTVAGVAGKVAGALEKAIVKKPRPVTKQMYSNKNLKKK